MTAGSPVKSINSIVLLYEAGDVDGLRTVWHPDVEVRSFDGDVLRGAEQVAARMRRLVEHEDVRFRVSHPCSSTAPMPSSRGS